MKKLFGLLLTGLCLCVLLTAAAAASSLTTLEINRAAQEGSNLHIYFRAEDENENPITDLTADNIELQMGGRILDTELVTDTAEGTGYVFAIDISKSLSDEQFSSVKQALASWVSSLGENDRMALVTFGTEITTAADFTADASVLTSAIDGLALTDDYTRLYGGIERAVSIANRQNSDLPTRRVVVVISDCMEDYEDSSGISELQDTVSDAMVPLVILGIDSEDNQDSLNAMLSVVRVSGGRMFRYDKDSISQGFEDLQSFLGSVCHLTAAIPKASMDGAEHGVVLTVSYNGSQADDGLDVRIKAESDGGTGTDSDAEETEEASQSDAAAADTDADAPNIDEPDNKSTLPVLIIGAAALLLCAGLVVLIVVLVRRGRKMDGKSADRARVPASEAGTMVPFGNETAGIGGAGSEDRTVPINGYGGASGTVVLTDHQMGHAYSVPAKNRIAIGRSEERNDIVLPDPTVSGVHAELLFENGVIYLRDCNSHNGTFIVSNGIRTQADSIMGVRVQQGDEILVGRTQLTVTQI